MIFIEKKKQEIVSDIHTEKLLWDKATTREKKALQVEGKHNKHGNDDWR